MGRRPAALSSLKMASKASSCSRSLLIIWQYRLSFKFSRDREGYKIRWIFGQKSTYSRETYMLSIEMVPRCQKVQISDFQRQFSKI